MSSRFDGLVASVLRGFVMPIKHGGCADCDQYTICSSCGGRSHYIDVGGCDDDECCGVNFYLCQDCGLHEYLDD